MFSQVLRKSTWIALGDHYSSHHFILSVLPPYSLLLLLCNGQIQPAAESKEA